MGWCSCNPLAWDGILNSISNYFIFPSHEKEKGEKFCIWRRRTNLRDQVTLEKVTRFLSPGQGNFNHILFSESGRLRRTDFLQAFERTKSRALWDGKANLSLLGVQTKEIAFWKATPTDGITHTHLEWGGGKRRGKSSPMCFVGPCVFHITTTKSFSLDVINNCYLWKIQKGSRQTGVNEISKCWRTWSLIRWKTWTDFLARNLSGSCKTNNR